MFNDEELREDKELFFDDLMDTLPIEDNEEFDSLEYLKD